MREETKGRKAVVLLSGGVDSSTCLAIAASEGFQCYSLAFDYGQRHRVELEMASWQALRFNVLEHKQVRVDLACLGGSALTGSMQVPKKEPIEGIPVTYVPARNAVFLSVGLVWAEVLGTGDLFLGANQVDFSGYPDCRRPFIHAFEHMANQATRMGLEGRSICVHAPLLDLTKAQILRKGLELGVDYSKTHSCYDPVLEAKACGLCPSCRLRQRGFAEVGIEDPIAYEQRLEQAESTS